MGRPPSRSSALEISFDRIDEHQRRLRPPREQPLFHFGGAVVDRTPDTRIFGHLPRASLTPLEPFSPEMDLDRTTASFRQRPLVFAESVSCFTL
jgi:hypothetical protein